MLEVSLNFETQQVAIPVMTPIGFAAAKVYVSLFLCLKTNQINIYIQHMYTV